MGFWDNFRKKAKVTGQMIAEDQRMSNLDWDGLKRHLVEVHQYILENEVKALVALLQMKDPALLQKFGAAFKNNQFEMDFENVMYRMFWLGFSMGCGITDEQFPNELNELNNGLAECSRDNDRLLKSMGLNSEFELNCFTAIRQRMFEYGKEYGRKPEFAPFSPRRLYG